MYCNEQARYALDASALQRGSLMLVGCAKPIHYLIKKGED
jgi:hypothetical protein